MHKERVRRSNAKRPASERRAYENMRNERLRVQALMFLGGRCEHCGNNDMRVLQFDHCQGGGTIENRKIHSRGVARNVLQTPGKYQILCANCNWIKRYERNENKQRIDK